MSGSAADRGGLGEEYQLATTCPWCGRHNNWHAALLSGGGAVGGAPSDGARTMCLNCGQFGVFRAGPLGLTVRRATAGERRAMLADPRAARYVRAWERERGVDSPVWGNVL